MGIVLAGNDPELLTHQVAELPRIEPIVHGYRLRRPTRPACRATNCGAWPAGVPAGCFGPYLQAVLATFGSDRFGAYDWIMARRRRVCRAPRRRDFQAMIDRGCDGEAVGRQMLSLSNRLFRHWHRVREGTREGRARSRLRSVLRTTPRPSQTVSLGCA